MTSSQEELTAEVALASVQLEAKKALKYLREGNPTAALLWLERANRQLAHARSMLEQMQPNLLHSLVSLYRQKVNGESLIEQGEITEPWMDKGGKAYIHAVERTEGRKKRDTRTGEQHRR